MPRKTYSKKGSSCRVTFELPSDGNIKNVSLCGEFNDWNPRIQPMKRRKDGRFSTTLSLKSGQDYRFKYLLDRQRWENDWNAEKYVPTGVSLEENSVVAV